MSGRLTDHLAIGVLTGLIHRDIVDDVIRECGKREKRSRLLPAHVVMYYVLALNLFFGEAYEEVMRQLVNGLRFLGNWRDSWTVPSTSAISQARTRLGEAPMKLLFERIAVPMARAGTRGSWLRGLRVMAIDGLVLDVPATPANDQEFGRSGNATAPSPFPQVRLVALGECGTHGITDAAFGPVGTGEQTLAATLIARFTPDMLVLGDRNFYSYPAWQQAVATGAALLWRVSASLTLPVLEWLPDGSFRSVLKRVRSFSSRALVWSQSPCRQARMWLPDDLDRRSIPWKIQRAVDEGMAMTRNVGGEEDADLAVRNLACPTGVLPCHATRRLALLEKASLVDDEDRILICQMLDDIVAHDIAQGIGIPIPATKDRLLSPWTRIASRLRAHPAGLALLVAEQTFQKQAGVPRNLFLHEQWTYSLLDLPKRRSPQHQRLFNRRCLRPPGSSNHGCPSI